MKNEQTQSTSPIPCTIGMLTWNSEHALVRALESVRGFAEIIIADGGSSDRTIEIAKTYNAKIISQSHPGHPIVDFALERQRMLDVATQKWFFYLDADEIMSPGLHERIRTISQDSSDSNGVYRVQFEKTSGDQKIVYRTFKRYYQTRLFRTDLGIRFVKPIHERIEIPAGIHIGQIEESWYVVLEKEDLAPGYVCPKIWRRTKIQVSHWSSDKVRRDLGKSIVEQTKLIFQSLVKIVVVRLRYGRRGIPTMYEFVRIFYNVSLMIRIFQRAFQIYFRPAQQ